MSTLFNPAKDVPPFVHNGPFISVFVVHEVLDQGAYEGYQAISDGQSLKPDQFGGEVLGFSKPVFTFVGQDEAHAVAVIKWPDFDSFAAWRTQDVYRGAEIAELHARAERESVYFLPCLP